MRFRIARAAFSLAVAAAIRVVWLFGDYWRGRANVRAFHIESAAVLFIALVAVAWSCGLAPDSELETRPEGASDANWIWWLFPLGALALYAPALRVGLLSDDFVLIDRAHQWQLGSISSYVFRPVSTLLWGLFEHSGASLPVFHAAIILLHGVVAALTVRVAAAWLTSRRAPMLAGLFVLTFPTAVEPVVWLANGFENVVMGALVLMAVLVSRRYGAGAAARDRLLCASLVVAAVLAKETAAVAGVLILIDAFVRRRLTRQLLTDASILSVAALAYGAMRVATATDAPPREITWYSLQRTIFQAFGSLAQQWPATGRSLWLPVATIGVVALLGLVLAATWRPRRDVFRILAAAAAWSFVSVLPVFGWILIGPNLRDSRWLYLAAPVWAIALSSLVAAPRNRWLHASSVTMAGLIVLLNVSAVKWQIDAWDRAADLRDRIVSATNGNPSARACGVISLAGLPDNVDGAYVLLNGAPEALIRARSTVRIGAAGPRCHFRWNGSSVVQEAGAAPLAARGLY